MKQGYIINILQTAEAKARSEDGTYTDLAQENSKDSAYDPYEPTR